MPPTTVKTEFVAVAPDSSGVVSAAVTPVLPVGATPHGRGIAVTILALIAVVAALEVAQTFFVSLLLGIIVAYTLNPLVAYLERIRIPRAAGAILVMAGVMGALGFGAYSLRGQVQSIIEQLPEATRTFSAAVARLRTMPGGNLQKVQNAAAEVEKATTQGAPRLRSPSRRRRTSWSTSPGSSSTTCFSRAPWARSAHWARRSRCCSWRSSCCWAETCSGARWCA